ncbi:unnamed protein product [Penicillium nalgiovense]|nr:unnamed protein product [Penicillium nalgiovense]
MFVAAKNREETSIFEFVSQPCGPRKLARTLDLCMKRRLDQQCGRPSPELTRWVEMPESSRLPLDLEVSDPPQERMKISKRPSTDTIRGPGCRNPRSQSSEGSREVESQIIARPRSPPREGQGSTELPSPSVLLVDDNGLNLQLLCAYTKKGNYEYMTAQDGAEAVATYEAHPGKFRVVILDISMPVMDGFEAARQIRRLEKAYRAGLSESARHALPPTIVAALTGLNSLDAQKEAFGSGIDNFLIKPVKRPDLHAILQRMEEHL